MLYASLTFWLLVIMFCAWGVHTIWSRLIQPRVVNSILLPGTLVAQLGHVLGLLITGNAVQNTALMGDDEKGEPQSETPEPSRVPIIGPILIALLPLAACAGGLYAAAQLWGGAILSNLAGGATVPQALPMTLPAVWDLLRGSITLTEHVLDAIIHADLPNWPTALFLYLSICLTVRMAPFAGNRRGAIGAICLAGALTGVIASLTGQADWLVESTWPILSFAVAMLLFLLLVSLLVSGIVGLIRVLVRE